MQQAPTQYDVVIMGGGLAGLTLARQLLRARPETRVLVLEKAQHPVPEAAWKVGESSVEMGAWYFDKVLGLSDTIQQDHLPKFGLRFFFNSGTRLDQGLEIGLTRRFVNPSYQFARGRLENYLAQHLSPGTFQDRCSIIEAAPAEDGAPHRVTYRQDGNTHTVTGRWLVDASGRRGLLKQKLSLAESVNHKINAVWFRIPAKIQIDDWCPHQITMAEPLPRWLSTNHLMGQGYWVWLIPLAGGATSVGIVTDPRFHALRELNSPAKAMAWLQRHEPLCYAAVRPYENQMMDFLAVKHFTYGCRRLFSADRWALTGEAGMFLDPFYSPGSDFIGINNTMICTMVLRSLQGRSIAAMAEIYEQQFRSLFQNTLKVYKDQYQLFGNPTIMTLKIFWDYAVYWCVPALLFFQGGMTDLMVLAELQPLGERLGKRNARMQAFFRQWHQVMKTPDPRGFIDQGSVALMHQLNRELSADLDRTALTAKLAANLDILDALSTEIITHALPHHPELAGFLPENARTDSNYLHDIYPALNLSASGTP